LQPQSGLGGSPTPQRHSRASGRLSSAARDRVLEKLVKHLKNKRASLRHENEKLLLTLEANLVKNLQLRRVLEREIARFLDHNRSLQRVLDHRPQDQQHGWTAVRPSVSDPSHEPPTPSQSVLENGQGWMRRDLIHGYCSASNEGNETVARNHSCGSFSDPSYESLLSSCSDLDNGRGLMQGDSTSTPNSAREKR
jgi:hypothetical protein